MALNHGTTAPANSIAERKLQLRQLYEASGIFTFDREFDANADIYFINTNPQFAKASFRYNLSGHSSASQTNRSAYSLYYSTNFDDSGTNNPSSSQARTFSGSAAVSNGGNSAHFVDYDIPFQYIYINQPGVKFLRLMGGTYTLTFMIAKPQGRESVYYIDTGGNGTQFSHYFWNRNVNPLITTRQFTPVQEFTMDGINLHDRMIQQKAPWDSPDTAVTITTSLSTADLPDIYGFSRQGALIAQNQIYHNELDGFDYFSPNANGQVLIRLTEGGNPASTDTVMDFYAEK